MFWRGDRNGISVFISCLRRVFELRSCVKHLVRLCCKVNKVFRKSENHLLFLPVTFGLSVRSQQRLVFFARTKQAASLFHLFVIFHIILYRSRLIIVMSHDVGSKQLLDKDFVAFKVRGKIMLQFFLKSLKFRFGFFVLAFKLCRFLKLVKHLTALCIVFETALHNTLLEVSKVFVRYFEISCWCY